MSSQHALLGPLRPRSTPLPRGRSGAMLVASLGAALAACSPSETSIVITYPSAGAKQATKAIAIYAFGPDDSSARARCRDYVGKLPGGEPLGANPVDNPFALDGEKRLTNFPAGDPVVVVVALNSDDPSRAKPILQGCTDTYGGDDGYSDVPIALEVIIPARSAMAKVGGDHQVAALGADLSEPLRVRVDTAFDMATQRDRYVLPAVPLTFSVMAGGEGVSLGGGAPGASFQALTDAQGEVAVPVKLPPAAGTFTIKVVSTEIAEACEAGLENGSATACRAPSERSFIVSAVDTDISLRGGNVIRGPALERAVGIAVGNVVGTAAQDAVVLGCEGTASGCLPGRCAGYPVECAVEPCAIDALTCERPSAGARPGPVGVSRLSVISDVAGSPTVGAPMGVDLGITPGGVFAGPLVPGGLDDVALVNSRRADCQGRGCESSEMLVFAGGTAGLTLASRQTLTGSNAVSLVGVRRPNAPLYSTLLTAAQGRSTVGRPCSRASICLFDQRFSCPGSGLSDQACANLCYDITQPIDPRCVDECATRPEDCGCPPQERCECVDADGCPNATQPGRCVPQDKFVDRLANGNAEETPVEDFTNELGCQMRDVRCIKNGDGVSSQCKCLDDALRGNSCQAEDGCGCKVPSQISIGDQAGVVANDIAVGKLQNLQGIDLVAASEGGIDFLPRTQDASFRWSIRKTPMGIVHLVRTVKLDFDEIDDIVWLAKGACDDFTSVNDPCPLARRPVDGLLDGAAPAGCMGLYVRANNNNIETTTDDGCRRFHLPIRPEGVCTGDVNGDAKSDIVVSGFGGTSVLVYLGDNNGGLLDPPLAVAIPSGGQGGLLACGDVDGDGLTDVLALGKTGVVSVLRTGP